MMSKASTYWSVERVRTFNNITVRVGEVVGAVVGLGVGQPHKTNKSKNLEHHLVEESSNDSS